MSSGFKRISIVKDDNYILQCRVPKSVSRMISQQKVVFTTRIIYSVLSDNEELQDPLNGSATVLSSSTQ